MSFIGLCKFALLAAHVVTSIATPLENRASEELVQTPAGFFPKSNVHAVPDGATVHQSPTESAGVLQRPNSTTTSRRALQSGYVAFTNWRNAGPSPISFFGTNWHVPPIPSTWNGQLLYWFNGLVPDDFNGILQPVLQYGVSPAGGGQFYSIASWWLIDNNVYHTGITPVSPGTFLQGQMTLTGTSTSGGVTTYSYSCTFVGYPGTTISASSTRVLNRAYEALEIYTTQVKSDLPSGNTVFSTINITFQNGQHPSSIPWEAISDPTDGITITVLSDSGPLVPFSLYIRVMGILELVDKGTSSKS
ncbi:hypothetical protein CPB84DRAFT_1848581 [Gymnopilus junonius]|uniref:Uncharacterized protein n=1 Tax=Gymnopilus junonius TaxID=109634 RepID=A0A9P5NHX0_GYMJU|nr:hypothetical protein CPB84DRAFT_1848581 [Gymnopilus junonius]